jgi:hypothetical protein
VGPTTLFDKSFLQSLSLDESVWFDHFFYPNVCPIFYLETLADLSKTGTATGREPDAEVRIIADKTPELAGGPCGHHRDLCISNLMGQRLPMTGQIPVAGARPVQSKSGHSGIVYDATPETLAFTRWQRQEFHDLERQFAGAWRQMLTELDLEAVARRMRALGIDSQSCKSFDQAHAIATALVRSRTQAFDQMALLFAFVHIPPPLQRQILQRWSVDQYRPLSDYAPYAAHVLSVELYFQIAVAAKLISSDRPSNRVDIGYLFYLPFCTLFTSSDKLHRRSVAPYLRSDQEFVWGPDFKAALAAINKHYLSLPEAQRELGIMRFAHTPPPDAGPLIAALWDRHRPGWRDPPKVEPKHDPEARKKLADSLIEFSKAPTVAAGPTDKHFLDPERVSIERQVRKRKGSWWQLPKGLKAPDESS